jgi:hypothetical protein
MKHLALRQLVYQANEFARFKILGVVSLLEVVQFLEDSDRNSYIMFVKIED